MRRSSLLSLIPFSIYNKFMMRETLNDVRGQKKKIKRKAVERKQAYMQQSSFYFR